MAKKYDYSLETVNANHFNVIKRLFEHVYIPYVQSTVFDNGTKIYKLWYSEDDIDANVNKDLFLEALEYLAIRYNL